MSASRSARIGSNQIIGGTTLEIQADRGTLSLYSSDGRTLLKVTGLPFPLPNFLEHLPGTQELTIEVVTSNDTNAGEGAQVATAQPTTASHLKAILRRAGATLLPKV